MMKQAAEMQQKLTSMQAEMEAREIEGDSGGGAVKLTLSGKGQLLRISLSDDALADREMLEDLILAAHRDAKDKADAAMADAMSSATSGLNLPAGFKLPL
ncbi:MAG: YbaB/EbfC family nucleoid-associated protein [Alphaproteobacteria bacterium]